MAYICRTRVKDPRTGLVHDYRRKRDDVEAVGVVGWNESATNLATAMSAAEKRKDACEGRSVIVALPCELDPMTRERLVVAWCSELRARHSVACAYALHRPDPRGDERNYHAHIIVTARRSDGTELGSKTRELDSPKTGGSQIEAWRKAWEEQCRIALTQAGATASVDMRSWRRRLQNANLPRNLIPADEHLGPSRVAAERRGQRTTAGERNRERSKRRGEYLSMAAMGLKLKRQIRKAKAVADDKTVLPMRLDPTQVAALIRKAYEAKAAATGGISHRGRFNIGTPKENHKGRRGTPVRESDRRKLVQGERD